MLTKAAWFLAAIAVPLFASVHFEDVKKDSVALVNVAGIERWGRPISPDGLLMEWSPSTAGKVAGDYLFRWDAINTKPGLAGYLLFDDTAKMPESFVLQPVGGSEFRCYPRKGSDGIFGISREGTGCTIEWLVPIDSLHADPKNGRYAVALALCAPGRMSGPVSILYNGTRSDKMPTLFKFSSPAVLRQSLLIMILSALYIWLSLRIRRRKKETKRLGLKD